MAKPKLNRDVAASGYHQSDLEQAKFHQQKDNAIAVNVHRSNIDQIYTIAQLYLDHSSAATADFNNILMRDFDDRCELTFQDGTDTQFFIRVFKNDNLTEAQGSPIIAPTGFLFEDNSSFILLEDDTFKLLFEN